MNPRNRGPALLIAAGLALFVAACGGSPSTPVDPNANNPGPVSEPPKTDPEPTTTTPDFPPPPT